MCLPIFTKMISTIKFRKNNLLAAAKGGYTNATDVADYLVKKGIPFRTSHEITGKIVAYCIGSNKNIDELSMDELKTFSDKFDKDLYEAISLDTCINKRNLPGGPAVESVEKSIYNVKKSLGL